MLVMPTYKYVCERCGHEFELFQSIKAEPLTVCPEEMCPLKPWGQGKVKRVPQAGAGLIFKGSGFYATDYRSKEYKEAVKKEAQAQTAGKSAERSEKGGVSKTEWDK